MPVGHAGKTGDVAGGARTGLTGGAWTGVSSEGSLSWREFLVQVHQRTTFGSRETSRTTT